MEEDSSAKGRITRSWLVATLVLVSLVAGCTSAPHLTQRAEPDRVTPCVRQPLRGLWDCRSATQYAQMTPVSLRGTRER